VDNGRIPGTGIFNNIMHRRPSTCTNRKLSNTPATTHGLSIVIPHFSCGINRMTNRTVPFLSYLTFKRVKFYHQVR